jgi:hypothetical protein
VGEARRRDSKPLGELEKARRFGLRFWRLYPKSARVVVKFEAQLIVWFAIVFGLLFLVALVVRLIHG